MKSAVSASAMMVVVALHSVPALGEDWFSTAGFSCSGNMNLAAAIEPLLGKGPDIKKAQGPGNFYASMSAESYNKLRNNGSDTIQGAHTITMQEAQSLAIAVSNVAEGAKVPGFVGPGVDLLTGLTMGLVSGLANEFLFNQFFDEINAFAADARTLSFFIAEDGSLYRRLVAKKGSKNEPYVVVTNEYKVSVGKSSRTFALTGCIYPLEVIVNEFATEGPHNNKIVRRIEGVKWKVWDIEGNKYDPDDWTYLYQSEGYYYFSKDAIENDNVVGQNIYRLSLRDGPWEYKSFFAGPAATFKQQYAKVQIR